MPDPCFYCEEPVEEDDSEVCTQCAELMFELCAGQKLFVYQMEEAA